MASTKLIQILSSTDKHNFANTPSLYKGWQKNDQLGMNKEQLIICGMIGILENVLIDGIE